MFSWKRAILCYYVNMSYKKGITSNDCLSLTIVSLSFMLHNSRLFYYWEERQSAHRINSCYIHGCSLQRYKLFFFFFWSAVHLKALPMKVSEFYIQPLFLGGAKVAKIHKSTYSCFKVKVIQDGWLQVAVAYISRGNKESIKDQEGINCV